MFITQQYAKSIVDEMKQAIHQDINIMDENGIILASTNAARQGQLHQGAVQVLREHLSSLTIWEDAPEQGVQQGINLPIFLEGTAVGVIGITGAPEKVAAFGHIIKRMTEIMVESAHQKEQFNLLAQAKSLFLENWLFAEQPDWSELEMRGRLLGMDIHVPYTAALLDVAETAQADPMRKEELQEMRSGMILRMVQERLLVNPNHYCSMIQNRMVVLLCRCKRGEAFALLQGICREIEERYPVTVSGGISSQSKSPEDIRRCYLEAKTAAAAALGHSGHSLVLYDEASLAFIAQSIPVSVRQDLERLIFSNCTKQEREEFVQTIRIYFDQDGDIQRCAQQLYLHRNTFQYRIDRLKKKTGYNLRIPKDALLLYLAGQVIPE